MATIDKILRKSNFTAAMTALITKLNGLFVRKEIGKGLSSNDYTAAEKEKLAGVAAGANNYVLPAPTTSTIGGVKAGNNVTISEDGTISAIQGRVDLSPYAKTADVNTALGKKADVATALKGYGITDAKIANGVITLGANTITPPYPTPVPCRVCKERRCRSYLCEKSRHHNRLQVSREREHLCGSPR